MVAATAGRGAASAHLDRRSAAWERPRVRSPASASRRSATRACAVAGPRLRILREGPLEDLVDPRRKRRVECGGARHVRIEMGESLRRRCVSFEGPAPREQLESDDRERIPVARGRRGLAAGLLRREIARSPQHGAGSRQRVDPRDRGDPEVGDVHVAVSIEEEVRRLDVSMNHAVLVRAVERTGRLLEPGQGVGARHDTAAKTLVDGAAVDVLHDDERSSAVLGDVEDRHDVRCVRETSGRERLASETCASVVLLRVPVGEQLDGDGPRQHGIRRPIHVAHSAVRDQDGRVVSPRKHVPGDPIPIPERARLDTAGQRNRNPSPSGSWGSRVKTCSPVRYALPSMSVITAGMPATSASPTTRARNSVSTMPR